MPNFSGVWNLKEQIQAIAAGRWTGIPLGELYAWGSNSAGRLGDNTTVYKSSPIQVGALTTWSQVSAGNSFTAAITTSGELYAWGNNPFGQLGDNTAVAKSSPVQVGALTNWAQVSAGSGSFCAAIKTDGTLWTWGRGGSGRLGDGTDITKSSPVQVGALTNWAQVSAGSEHAAAITTGGVLYAWGDNSNGQVGDNTTVNKSSPVGVGALTNWLQVSADLSTTSVKTDGTMWAWGGNNYGQLGQNDTVKRSSPVQIGGLTTWSQVSVSGQVLAILGGTTN